MSEPLKGLLVDFGGVLTTNVFESFRGFCETEGLAPDAFLTLMRDRPEARTDLRRVETGEITEQEFCVILGGHLGIAETDGLIDRLFAGMSPDVAMVDAVRKAKSLGIRTG